MFPHLVRIAATLAFFAPALLAADQLERIKFNHPGLVVDLAVGLWAWPVPADADGDGDLDLIVVCPDKPYNGTYLFENATGDTAREKFPVFKPARRISDGASNVTPSYVGGRLRVCTAGKEYPDFVRTGLASPVKLPPPANVHHNKVRFNQWRYVDYDGDGLTDLTIGVEDWTDYGWDRAFNEKGEWTRGPLRGFVYVLRNTGSNESPAYAAAVKIEVEGKPLETFGCPSQSFADFDGDGDLDLVCGEFLDGFTYFENAGTRALPKYRPGRRLVHEGKPLAMDLEMIVVTPIDWDKDGDTDLVVAQEDGRVALVENRGRIVEGMPDFLPPHFFQQEADSVKFGALATPVGVDWDGDGAEDIVAGNSAGYIGFIRNLGPGAGGMPKWDAPRYLEAGGAPIRFMAGPNGSVQGPAEAKWGYTTLNVADWDGDGLPDLVVNSIWGRIVWHRNIGTRTAPKLALAEPIEVQWAGAAPKPAWFWWQPQGRELVTQWRTTPLVHDWTKDGLPDLAVLDPEGFLALFERRRAGDALVLTPGRRIFIGETGSDYNAAGKLLNDARGPLRLNTGEGGPSGRRKLCIADWDGDGLPDLLANSVNANFLRATAAGTDAFVFRDSGPVDTRVLAGHDTSPTAVRWGKGALPDLLIGAEDGHFYFMRNPKSPEARPSAVVRSEFIYEQAPFPSCHATTIAEGKDGMVAAWFGGTSEGAPDVCIWLSRQISGQWSPPAKVADGGAHPCWNPVLFQTAQGGALVLFYKVGPNPRSWWGMWRTSDDGGATWSEPQILPDGFLGPIKNKPVQLGNGDFLCPTSTEDAGWRVHFERAADAAGPWTKTGPLNDGVAIAAIQPSVLFLGGDKLAAIGRTRQGRIFRTASEDAGKTWSKMTLTELPNPNSGTDAMTLRDGRHLLVYNHTAKGRSPLNIAISGDSVAWEAALVLEMQPGEYSYPAVIQTADGLVHITYTWKRERVRHVVIDPARITAQPMTGGRWPE